MKKSSATTTSTNLANNLSIYGLPDYEVLELIGSGSTANVYRVVHKMTNINYALKVVRKQTDEFNDSVRNEIEVMKVIEPHPNICKFYQWAEDANNFYEVLEYMSNGTLLDYVNNNKRLPEAACANIVSQIGNALLYLHSNNIAHLDLKLENVMLDKYHKVKLVDFGFSQIVRKDAQLQLKIGSIPYMSPEIVCGQPYAYPADIWALGIITYTMFFHNMPFKSDNTRDLISSIVMMRPPIKDGIISNIMNDFLNRTLCKDQNLRITIKEVLKHPWLNCTEEKGTSASIFQKCASYDAVKGRRESLKPSSNSPKSNSPKKKGSSIIGQAGLALTMTAASTRMSAPAANSGTTASMAMGETIGTMVAPKILRLNQEIVINSRHRGSSLLFAGGCTAVATSS